MRIEHVNRPRQALRSLTTPAAAEAGIRDLLMNLLCVA